MAKQEQGHRMHITGARSAEDFALVVGSVCPLPPEHMQKIAVGRSTKKAQSQEAHLSDLDYQKGRLAEISTVKKVTPVLPMDQYPILCTRLTFCLHISL